ncbi:FAD-dependent tricarballylate dehydrogenase TcuA [Actinoalloteichus caeruleus]|uniref:Tricarballylate dehydrogenase n=1 Tax=Actinoalloteichus caeruleus DSM 43889 TaxID=1120930 RepID=A0ABT1JN43_ACTCY|nr:FAD-dependent tricarballylate dehydrogenase TcuA [Actinoalloteichus caeruleus]MCP2333950.1 tricarballylate dehydrogenase [Actinoalloteichus caeruleus DSM 43889]
MRSTPVSGSTAIPAPDAAERVDVVVVGGGNAAFSAAHAARERGASVLLLEKGVREAAGGNSYYTAGAFRFAHGGGRALAPILDEGSVERLPRTELPAYSADDFASDIARVTEGRNDPVLTRTLVDHSADTVDWLTGKGLRWQLLYERQTYVEDGRWVFFGGLAVGTVDGGKGLIAQHTAAAESAGVEIRYEAEVRELVRGDDGAVRGVVYQDGSGAHHEVAAGAVVLAAGGFEANPDLRERHLGPGWSRALVRGNPLNTGEVLEMALAAGAAPHGDWGSCHSVQWDAGASPDGGNRELTNQLTRQSYPVGIVVNRDGRRFIDEGADYRNFTYAKYGREVLAQPEGVAYQLFDAKTRPILRTLEYDSEPITSAVADSLEELADKLGVDRDGLMGTVREFNESIVDVEFTPAVKDGRAARVDPPKSNWAQALDTAPFYGYPVACGITFTFGGVRVHHETAQVLTAAGEGIGGLYAAGELVGGLFSGNYPGGSGLTAGAVFGRLAGYAAAGESAQLRA